MSNGTRKGDLWQPLRNDWLPLVNTGPRGVLYMRLKLVWVHAHAQAFMLDVQVIGAIMADEWHKRIYSHDFIFILTKENVN